MNRYVIWLLAAALIPFAAPVSADTWDGWYLGVNGGYGFGNAKVDTSLSGTGYFEDSSRTSINANGHQSLHPDSITGGAQAGYDTESFGVVWGVVADVDALDAHDNASTTVTYPCCDTAYTIASKVQTNWMATLRARVGFDWDNILFYATGGGAWTDVHGKYQFSDNDSGALENASKSSVETGWAIGGGVELPVADEWTIGAEFLHVDFGTMLAKGNLNLGSNIFTHKLYLRDDIVRATVNFRLP